KMKRPFPDLKSPLPRKTANPHLQKFRRKRRSSRLELRLSESKSGFFLRPVATNEGVRSVLLIEAAERPGDPGLALRRRLSDNVRRKGSETKQWQIRFDYY